MPRRRKKTDDKKHPLIFTESPCDGQRHDSTVLFAAHSPVTADIITVDPNDTSAWVSPQFRASQMACSEPRRRKHRTKKTSNNQSAVVGRRKRNPSGQENVTVVQAGDIRTRLKYRKLKFEGEQTVVDHSSTSSNNSTLEDLDISEEEYEQTCLEKEQNTPNVKAKKLQGYVSEAMDRDEENRMCSREPLLPPKDWTDVLNSAARNVFVHDTPVGYYGMKASARRRQEVLQAKRLSSLK